ILQRRGGAASAVALGPAGNPRFNVVPESIIRDRSLKFVVMGDRVRPWTDQRHFAAQDIEKLRQLINARFAQKAPDPSDSRIPPRSLADGRAIIPRGHGSEFVDYELFAVEPITTLTKDDWPGRIKLNCDHRQSYNRKCRDGCDRSQHDI